MVRWGGGREKQAGLSRERVSDPAVCVGASRCHDRQGRHGWRDGGVVYPSGPCWLLSIQPGAPAYLRAFITSMILSTASTNLSEE